MSVADNALHHHVAIARTLACRLRPDSFGNVTAPKTAPSKVVYDGNRVLFSVRPCGPNRGTNHTRAEPGYCL
jgi:hypothetical protein